MKVNLKHLVKQAQRDREFALADCKRDFATWFHEYLRPGAKACYEIYGEEDKFDEQKFLADLTEEQQKFFHYASRVLGKTYSRGLLDGAMTTHEDITKRLSQTVEDITADLSGSLEDFSDSESYGDSLVGISYTKRLEQRSENAST